MVANGLQLAEVGAFTTKLPLENETPPFG